MLAQNLSVPDRQLVLEFGQAARLARESIEAGSCDELWKEMEFETIRLGRDPGKFRYPFSEESVDKILCADALSRIFNPQEVVCEMFRILRPGGTLVISQFHREPNLRNGDSQALHIFSGDELNEMFVLAGFHDVNLVKKFGESALVVACSARK
jgi:SAM-dependent methyltransferase